MDARTKLVGVIRETMGDGFYCRDEAGDLADAILAAYPQIAWEMGEIRIIFDGPPSHQSGRFIEVETVDGRSIDAGEWVKRSVYRWELRIPRLLATTTKREKLNERS